MADNLHEDVKEEMAEEEEVQNDNCSVKEEEEEQVNDDSNDNEQANANPDTSQDWKVSPDGIYIRLRGLPWDVTKQDIIDFLGDAKVVNGEEGVYICKNRKDDKLTGRAYVHLETEEDETEAFTHNKQDLGHRYIEIFKASADEITSAMNKSKPRQSKIVKLRGLPFSSTFDTIDDFFDGLDVDREGIVFTYNRQGRATGEAYVPFNTAADAQKALERNREKIENRYIEIFPSTLFDLKKAAGMGSSPYDRPRNGGRFNNGPNNRNNRRGGDRDGRRGGNRGSWSNNSDNNGRRNNFGNRGGNFGNNGGNFGNGGGNFGMGNNGNFGMGNGNFGMNNGNFGNGFGMNNSGNNNGAFCIRMRGLPYRAYENEISDFFAPLNTAKIEVIYNKKGLHSGTANVYFCSADDAIQAMRKHNGQMGSRYIELFYDGNTSNGGRF